MKTFSTLVMLLSCFTAGFQYARGRAMGWDNERFWWFFIDLALTAFFLAVIRMKKDDSDNETK